MLVIRRAQKEGVPVESMIDLFFCIILSAIIGSRALHVLVNYNLFRENPLKMFKIWEGGLVFYGGLLLAIIVSFGYVRWRRLPAWKIADLFSPSIALGLFFGRLGCFFAGCCYGKETHLPWGVLFTDPNSLARLNVSLHPTQVYEALGSLAIFFFLNWKRQKKTFDGEIFWLFLLLYSAIRFFFEYLRDDPRGFLFKGLFSTSQGIGVCLAIASFFMLFYLERKKRR
jgi:phosphatidylglycerol:prolipoprotein diacylglycerol transferase